MLRHLRARTKQEYGRRVHLLADHFGGVDPATLTEAQIADYFVFLIRDKGLRPSSIRQARAAIELFFTAVVKVQWAVFSTIRTRGAMPLPVVLSRAELAALFAAVKVERFRVFLRLLYGCGLRLGEALALEVRDIEGAAMRLTVRGFLRMQGEADAKHAASATEYAASLKRLKRRLEQDLGVPALPFVFGQVLPHEPAMERFTHRREIRESQRNADEASSHADAIPGVKMVSTDGFPLKPDTVHYTAAGLAKLGRAFADAMLGMVKM